MEMTRLALLFTALSTVLLAACGPQLATQYEIVPPPSDSGRYCANNCLIMKDQCEQNCWAQKNNCEQQNRIDGHLDYLTYMASRNMDNKPIKKGPDDFRGNNWCEADSCLMRCTQNFNVCHTNCGGKVIPHTYCTAFCEP